jgi:uncharacterized membrane protein YkvA (DUF1232 family)
VAEAALLIPNVIVLLIRLLADPRVSTRRKVLLGAVIAYAASPLDVIPDFLIGLGHLDDLILLSLATDRLLRSVDEEIVLEHWEGTVDGLDVIRSVFAWGADIVPSVFRRMLPR